MQFVADHPRNYRYFGAGGKGLKDPAKRCWNQRASELDNAVGTCLKARTAASWN